MYVHMMHHHCPTLILLISLTGRFMLVPLGRISAAMRCETSCTKPENLYYVKNALPVGY